MSMGSMLKAGDGVRQVTIQFSSFYGPGKAVS